MTINEAERLLVASAAKFVNYEEAEYFAGKQVDNHLSGLIVEER